MVEALADLARQLRHLHHMQPVEQQIVVVEDVLRLLRADIRVEERLQFRLPVGAPRERDRQHFGERCLAVHRPRIDGETRCRHRESLPGCGKPEVMTRDCDQILSIGAIMNRERRMEPDARRVFP